MLLERAIALDSTWYAPVIEYAARSPTGNTDLAALESLMPSLQAGERDLLQYKRAMWSLDRELMYRTARALFDRSPATFWRPLVQEAMAVNRPAVVIAAGAYRDVPSLTTNPLHPDQNSHLTYGYALHNVGRYKEQLALGAEVRREFPANLRVALIQEIMALAALGRTDELAPLVELSESDADRGAAYLVASQAWMAGQELAAHGNPELAEEYFARWVNRIEEAAAREPNSRQRQVVLAQAYLVAGRFEQAAAHHAALLKSPAPDSLLVIGEYGQALAGLGRRDEANAVIDRLEAIVAGRSENIRRLHQGLISARLGDKPRALAYLRQAVASGSVLFVFQHRNAALNNLRDYPPFIDFVRLRE